MQIKLFINDGQNCEQLKHHIYNIIYSTIWWKYARTYVYAYICICILLEGNIKGTDLCTSPMYQLRKDEVDTLFDKTWLIWYTSQQTVIGSELTGYIIDKYLLCMAGMWEMSSLQKVYWLKGQPEVNWPSAVSTYTMYQPKEGFIYYTYTYTITLYDTLWMRGTTLW